MQNNITNKEYLNWLAHLPEGSELKKELDSISGDESEISMRFDIPMRFGTAGLRAVMGVGTARMNEYTVARATYALAYIINERNLASRGVAIACDSRNNSKLFSKVSAEVLAAYGVKSYIFDDIRPTPELSFAILHLGCTAGINVTASHNPKEYNGYKVYWDDGAQMPPAEADAVAAIADATDVFEVKRMQFDEGVSKGLITVIGAEVDEAYINAVLDCRIDKTLLAEYGNKLHMAFTPLHGTGYKLVPEVLKRCGLTELGTVPEQTIPDGNFPTVQSPNPEYTSCFDLAIKNADPECTLMIGTDPDGDRIGVCVRDDEGRFFALSGNQIGALLADYIISSKKAQGTLADNACAIRSIVSGGLFDAICNDAGVEYIEVLTGFKYIGEKIKQWTADSSHEFIFGYEESHGYLSKGYARDKDAVAASMLVAEMACKCYSEGKTVYQALRALYAKHGWFAEAVVENKISGADPMTEMSRLMSALRADLPREICGVAVKAVRDYKSGIVTELVDGSTHPTDLPKSDVLYFELADGSTVIVRPSGTEPKAKLYILVKADSEQAVEDKLSFFSQFSIFR